ncbi:MAG: pyridoxal phosphate-dependent aminotransferase [Chloroflexi bacterium]|nr:MAG: pyridoxal phosphate-dependent aminotransferase [Chloroflexota bacterium]
MKFAQRMSRLGTETAFEVLARAKALEAQGRDIIHLEIGEPDFDTPAHIVEAGVRALREGHTHYTPAAGVPELRQAIARHISESRGIDARPEQVVVTPGAKPIMFFTILALAEAGDEVIYPNPGFPIYESMINFVGATPVPLPLREEHQFRFDADEFRSLVSDRTRLIILNSPQNPTGGVLTREDLQAVADVARERRIMVLSDEVYEQILYEGEHVSIASLPGMQELTILLDGYSKTYAMTGWRLGYGVMPVPLAEQVTKLMVNSNSCTAAFTQQAGIAALAGPKDRVRAMVEAFRERRDVIVNGLNQIPGIRCVMPAGAFYAFPNVTGTGLGSRELADRLLNQAGVATLPGDSFGAFGAGYLRLSYANSVENIRKALARIEEVVAGL